MSLPVPEPGLVISYAYLWRHEQAAGRAEGKKIRPCVIVVKVAHSREGIPIVSVAPITTKPPDPNAAAHELPAAVCRHLGLDAARSWVVLNELNQFGWPGFDLHPIPGSKNRFSYGFIPPRLFAQIVTEIRNVWRTQRGKIIGRD